MADSPYQTVAPTLLAIPQNYRNPQDINSTREYAKALMQGSGQQPVHHWTQGVSNIVSALMGGTLANQANQQQNEAAAVLSGRTTPTMPGSSAPSFSEGPSSEGTKNADTGDSSSKAIAGIESGGRYDALGPTTRTGDRAYGKYQVMGANIPEWTQVALGTAMTPEQFLANPQAQEAVFKNKFGEYTQKYGPEGAAKAWFAGEKGMNNPNAKDVNGMTVAAYADKFRGLGGNSPAMAFSGQDQASSASPAVQAVSSALRGEPSGVQVAAGKGPSPSTQPMVMPNGQSGPLIDPALVQRRPMYNEGQIRGIMADPTLTQQEKMQYLQMYQQQDQPIAMPYPGGTVLIDPRNPMRQQFIPELQKGIKKLPGGLEYPQFNTITPGPGGIQQNPIQAPAAIGPRSEATPPAAPAAAPQAAPAPSGGPVEAGSGPAPAAPAAASQAPVQVASLDKTAGIAPAPSAAPAPEITPVAAPGPANQGAIQLAQALGTGSKPPPGYSQEDWDAVRGYKNLENKTEIDKDAALKATDAGVKKYDTLSTQAQNARNLRNNVDLALGMMNDPNMHQGMLSGVQDVWSRFKEAALGDKFANAPNETFDKLMAGNVLGTMKTALGGLGQVRLAEIQLLNKANGNRYNTDASNRAVLEISRRGLEKVDQIDGMSQQYMSGDEVTDPNTGKVLLKANTGPDGEIAPRRGLDVGFDKIVRKWTNDNPSFTPEEIKNYETLFTSGKPPGEGGVKTNEKAPTENAPAVGTEKQFKQGTGVWNGKEWVPKGQ